MPRGGSQCLLNDNTRQEFLNGFLPKAHDDVIPALQTLKDKGYRRVAFPNSSSALITQQLEAAVNTAFQRDPVR